LSGCKEAGELRLSAREAQVMATFSSSWVAAWHLRWTIRIFSFLQCAAPPNYSRDITESIWVAFTPVSNFLLLGVAQKNIGWLQRVQLHSSGLLLVMFSLVATIHLPSFSICIDSLSTKRIKFKLATLTRSRNTLSSSHPAYHPLFS